MKVSKNAYYHWIKVKSVIMSESPKVKLMKRVRVIFEESRQIYDSYRIQKKLEREGLIYSRSYIGLLMQNMSLKSVLRKKYVVTTYSKHTFPIANNELNRDFTSFKLGEKWVSDITYIRVNNHQNYLKTIIDLAYRKIVGWTLSEGMTTENTLMKTLTIARENRNIINGFIFHSDRRVQYTSNKMTNIFSYNIKTTQSTPSTAWASKR